MECEECKDMGFILSNNETGNPDLQRCDYCKQFKNDADAKHFVLTYINQETSNE